ncbi:MAG TPA: phosphoribosyltransferase family protein, partial [Hyphomicrobium sp.]|nr:phosphoribosyltransferase family protein [Hyphomicrobium sp.]
ELMADAEVVVPVPLARRRLLQRRFNQAAILAQEVARLSHLGYEPLALERTRSTASQVGLTRDARRRNVAGAFIVPLRAAHRVQGRKILLVDDVITTGSTVGACARALRRAGAARVDVLALALVTDRGVIPS